MKTRCCCSKRYLLVFSILLVSVGSIFMSVSLSSCSSPSVKNPLLLCADSLMETCPDSALSILESITCPQKMPRADRALYVQSPNQKIPDRKTKCVIETHLNIKQNVILGANLKPV